MQAPKICNRNYRGLLTHAQVMQLTCSIPVGAQKLQQKLQRPPHICAGHAADQHPCRRGAPKDAGSVQQRWRQQRQRRHGSSGVQADVADGRRGGHAAAPGGGCSPQGWHHVHHRQHGRPRWALHGCGAWAPLAPVGGGALHVLRWVGVDCAGRGGCELDSGWGRPRASVVCHAPHLWPALARVCVCLASVCLTSVCVPRKCVPRKCVPRKCVPCKCVPRKCVPRKCMHATSWCACQARVLPPSLHHMLAPPDPKHARARSCAGACSTPRPTPHVICNLGSPRTPRSGSGGSGGCSSRPCAPLSAHFQAHSPQPLLCYCRQCCCCCCCCWWWWWRRQQ